MPDGRTHPCASDARCLLLAACGTIAGTAGTITIRHGYIETEEQVFSEAVAGFMEASPNITVEVLAVPFGDLQNSFRTEAAAGGGPTIVTGPEDRLAGHADADLLAEIDEDAEFISSLVPATVDGERVAGGVKG